MLVLDKNPGCRRLWYGQANDLMLLCLQWCHSDVPCVSPSSTGWCLMVAVSHHGITVP